MPAKKKAAKKKTARKRASALVPVDLVPEKIATRVAVLRGEKVLLDTDLAELYGVPTKRLNQAVKRNLDRFPEDFMFQLTEEEVEILRSQFATPRSADAALRSQSVTLDAPNLKSQSVTSKDAEDSLRSQIATLKTDDSIFQSGTSSGRGQHRKYLPYAFTEQGVAMLSSVLRSPRAVEVNIAIMRTFVQLRRLMDSNALLAEKIEKLERKYAEHDQQFQLVFDAIKQLIQTPDPPKRQIGFHTRE